MIIDVREACRPHRTGKGQWTYGLVSELLRRGADITLVTDTAVPSEWFSLKVERIPGRGFAWHRNVIRWLRGKPGETYVSPTSFIVPAFAPRSVSCMVVVHDLIAFHKEPHDRKARFIERLLLGRALRRAKRILTISDSTKQDLLRTFPDIDSSLVQAVYAGPMRKDPPGNISDGKTILCIGTLCPRKNQLRLIAAYASLSPQLRSKTALILAGARGWNDTEIIREADETSGVRWLRYVDSAEYDRLLSTCTVFALPSLYEGFGMQILDALQRGCVVVTSDRGSLIELANGAAVIADPLSVAAIAHGLERALTDDTLRADLSAKARERALRYSWERTADLVVSQL